MPGTGRYKMRLTIFADADELFNPRSDGGRYNLLTMLPSNQSDGQKDWPLAEICFCDFHFSTGIGSIQVLNFTSPFDDSISGGSVRPLVSG